MLGKTAGSLFWMFRYLERCENMARFTEAGFHMALTRSQSATSEWESIISSAGLKAEFKASGLSYEAEPVINFLLRDQDNHASVRSMIDIARMNARAARTALTRGVWEATNEAWMSITRALKDPVTTKSLPTLLGLIRRQTALVHGTLENSMLRNDIFDFARLGTYIERAESTARILDVKYYVLLPSVARVGGSLDHVQWETILRSVSGERAFRWARKSDVDARGIADFLILDPTMPRSLEFCHSQIHAYLDHLSRTYGAEHASQHMSKDIRTTLQLQNVDDILEAGLHEYISDFLGKNQALAAQIETDYRFYQ